MLYHAGRSTTVEARRFPAEESAAGAAVIATMEKTIIAPDTSLLDSDVVETIDVTAFNALFSANPLPMWIYDTATLEFLEVNAAATALYGYRREEFLDMRVSDIRPASEIPKLMSVIAEMERAPGYRSAGEWTHERKDGSTIYVDISSHRIRFRDRQAALVVAHDVTARKAAEDALRDSERRYRLLFERNLAGVYRNTVDGRVLSCNEACARILGYESAEELSATTAHEAYFDPADRSEMLARLHEQRQLTGAELRLKRKDGTAVWVLANITLVRDCSGDVIEGTLFDITEKKQAEEQVVYRAYHDSLTGLPNRALFKERLWVMLNHARRHSVGMAVMAIDLDRFKLLNDTMGHSVGDKLIKEVAARLSALVKDDDLLARAGGDEFLLLLADIHHAEDAARIAQSIQHSFDQPFTILGSDFYVSASIGIATYPGDGEDVETLLKNADAALFHAKTLGRNTYQLSTPQMTRKALELLALEHGLRRGLEREEFVLFYQPQMELASGRIIGVETLVRWQLSDGTHVEPGVFMGVAEETRLILPIGDWTLRRACRQAAEWQRSGLPPKRIAVNLSAYQFQRQDLLELIRSALDESGLAPEHLEVEITETTAMYDVEATSRILHNIKSLGVRVSMDDFGTGHSSLNHLRRFPLDMIKIDQTFVRDIHEGSSSAAIIEAIIAMAHALGLRVLAEGVETEEQREFLARRGCEEIQGFLISRPVPADAVTRMF